MSTVTIRPNAVGDETAIASQYPASTYHWDKVDEEVSDGYTTYVYEGTYYAWHRDLYNLQSPGISSGTINSVTIHAMMIGTRAEGSNMHVSQKSGSTVTDGSDQAVYTSWIDSSQTYTTNPATGSAYTWSEIESLQAGLATLPWGGHSLTCTQLWVVIDYSPPPDPFPVAYQSIMKRHGSFSGLLAQ